MVMLMCLIPIVADAYIDNEWYRKFSRRAHDASDLGDAVI